MTSLQSVKAAADAAVSGILQSNFDADSKTCLTTLIKVLDNLLQQPDNPKVRSIRLANKAFHTKVVEKKGVPLLLACGFVEERTAKLLEPETEAVLVLSEANEITEGLVAVRRLLTQVLRHQLQVPADEIPTMKPPKSKANLSSGAASGFNVFAGQRYDGQSAAVGASLGPPQGWKSQTDSQLELLQKKQAALQKKLQRTISRQWQATRPQEASTLPPNLLAAAQESLTTSGDSALLAAHMSKQQQERQAAENRGFTTKAMRDLEKLKKAKVYSHTQLAIQFPDGCLLKANFGPQETIGAVLSAIQEDALLDASLPPLELYITPPRQLLGPSETLQKLQLVPAAKVYVSWNKALPARGNGGLAGWYLRPALFATAQNPEAAKSQAVVEASIKAGGTTTKASDATSTAKRKKTKAEKEAAMLKRMMGGM